MKTIQASHTVQLQGKVKNIVMRIFKMTYSQIAVKRAQKVIIFLRYHQKLQTYSVFSSNQGPVVRKVDSAIRWIVIFSTFVKRDNAGRNVRFCQRNK